jgi:hypothetical protein
MGSCLFLTELHKKDCQQNILHNMLLAPARNGARWDKYVTYLFQRAPYGPVQEALCGAQAVWHLQST